MTVKRSFEKNGIDIEIDSVESKATSKHGFLKEEKEKKLREQERLLSKIKKLQDSKVDNVVGNVLVGLGLGGAIIGSVWALSQINSDSEDEVEPAAGPINNDKNKKDKV